VSLTSLHEHKDLAETQVFQKQNTSCRPDRCRNFSTQARHTASFTKFPPTQRLPDGADNLFHQFHHSLEGTAIICATASHNFTQAGQLVARKMERQLMTPMALSMYAEYIFIDKFT